MSKLALVYIDVTKHIVSAVLAQSGSGTPKLEDLVGTGPRIRDMTTLVPAINVASSAVGLKVLVFDTAFFATNQETLEGLLDNPLDYCLQLKDPTDPASPLIPVPADVTLGLDISPATTSPGISLTLGAVAKALTLLVLVQRGAIDSSPIASAPISIVPGAAAAPPFPLTVQSKDEAWLLVETQKPVLRTIT